MGIVMADKSVEQGFPVDGGAVEKLDYLAKQISVTLLKEASTDVHCNLSLSVKKTPDGKLYASGFQISVAS